MKERSLDEDVNRTESCPVNAIEPGAPFELSAAAEAELAEAIAEADGGDVISAGELLRRLSR